MHQPTHPLPPRRRTSPLAIAALIVGAVLVLLLIAVLVLMAASGSDGTTPVGGTAPGAAKSTHPAGSTATDDRFTFRITSMDTATRLKTETETVVSTKGRFVLVWVAVTNKAAKARFIGADDQQLHAGGKSYSVDVDATVDVDKGPEIGLPEKISGGDTETIELVYDVPESAKPTALEVHGSADSAGALIALPGN